jgi:hypothetical protein
LTFFSSLFDSGALKAANARVALLEAELEASRIAFDAATATKVNAEKFAKSALAKAKKAEKDLANANKEHLQREQAVAERLNQMSATAGGCWRVGDGTRRFLVRGELPASWEPQEEGMMSIAASFPSVKKPRFNIDQEKSRQYD